MSDDALLGNYCEITNPPPPDEEESAPVLPAALDPLWNYVLDRFELQDQARDLLPHERVVGCLRWRQNKLAPVDVKRDPDARRAWYSNLQTCGSVWICPVCSARISEQRRQDLALLGDMAKAQGLSLLMLTLTVQHNISDSLSWLLDGLQDASMRFRRGKAFAKLKDRYGVLGMVTALEVTWGADTGWHPHRHEIWIVDWSDLGPAGDEQAVAARAARAVELQEKLIERWQRMTAKEGLWASVEHGLDLKGPEGDYFIEYVAKFGHEPTAEHNEGWTLAHELAKGAVKVGRAKRLGPFGLLDGSRYSEDLRDRWLEYVRAFQGRQQLRYSRGLKAYFDFEPEADSVVASDVSSFVELLAHLPPDVWRRVVRSGKRAQLLRVAADGDRRRLLAFIEELPEVPHG